MSSATVDSAAEFTSALANLCDGGVIHIPANTTIIFDNAANQTLLNKSFTLEGVDTTSVIDVRHSGTGVHLIAATDNEHSHSATIQNIKFIHDASGTGFISLSGFDNIEISNVVMDLNTQDFGLNGRTIMVDGIDLQSHSTGGLTLSTSDALGEFDHTIQNSRIEYTATSATNGPVSSTLNTDDGGTITWTNNTFVGAAAGAGQPWYSIHGTINDAVTIHMTDNDFRKRIVEVNCNESLGESGSIAFDLDCNNSTLDVCPSDLIVELGGNDVTVSESGTWQLDYGACFSSLSLGSVTGQNACFWDDYALVEFDLGNTTGAEPAISAYVRWADNNCTTSYVDVPAWYNADTGKWNCSFDVSAIGDGSFYWQGRATLCGASVAGSCQQGFTGALCTRSGGGEGPPPWFTEQ